MDVGTNRSPPGAELSLGPDPRSADAARRFLASTLKEWRATAYRDDAVLLLSELVANAALHADTEIVVRIELQPEFLLLAVTDGSARQPVLRHYSDQATTGRGLSMVDTLARRWGVEPHPNGSKTVWAEVGSGDVAEDRIPVEEPAIDRSRVADLLEHPGLPQPSEVPQARSLAEPATPPFLQAA